MPKFNDIDLKNWEQVDIWTDSLWLIDKRDNSGKHDNFYHGNFVPQIPNQLIRRYTKANEWVFDPFLGSGTTAFECEKLGRNLIGVDVQPQLIAHVNNKLDLKSNTFELLAADSSRTETYLKISDLLAKFQKRFYQFAILHPPYSDIIKFSDESGDMSLISDLNLFLEKFTEVLINTFNLLEPNRYMALVIGDKYAHSQWVPLGFECMNRALKVGFKLKSIIVKNMEGNRAKQNLQSIWRYRALSSDYYIFKHEYIFLFKK